MFKQIFQVMFNLLKAAAPTIIGILVALMVVWILMLQGCFEALGDRSGRYADDPIEVAEPSEFETPVIIEQEVEPGTE